MATEKYKELWSTLGLNLQNHDGLLQVLGKTYGGLFLTQKSRPQTMDYFNFVVSEIHGFRVAEIAKAKDSKDHPLVVGGYCTFIPEELVVAVGGIMIGLCAGAEVASEQAERYVPRNTCSLIKSTLGFKLAGVCPYLELCDLIVGELTCEGKSKAWEVFPDIIKKPFHVIEMPKTRGNDRSIKLLAEEYARFATKLEQLSGKKITPESLRAATEIVNAKRRALQRLADLRSADPAPISGLDSLLVNQIAFFDDPVRFTASVNKICDELETRIANKEWTNDQFPKGTPRLLISGCPMALPNWKVPAIVETSGAVIVGEETCTGERGFQKGQIEIPAEGMDVAQMIQKLSERYNCIDCAIFSENKSRLAHIEELVKRTKAQGVVLYGLHFCTSYLFEAMDFERQLEKKGIPTLRIETDYSAEDSAQLKTRLEAFIERIKQ